MSSAILTRLRRYLTAEEAAVVDRYVASHGERRVVDALACDRHERALFDAIVRRWRLGGRSAASVARLLGCSETRAEDATAPPERRVAIAAAKREARARTRAMLAAARAQEGAR